MKRFNALRHDQFPALQRHKPPLVEDAIESNMPFLQYVVWCVASGAKAAPFCLMRCMARQKYDRRSWSTSRQLMMHRCVSDISPAVLATTVVSLCKFRAAWPCRERAQECHTQPPELLFEPRFWHFTRTRSLSPRSESSETKPQGVLPCSVLSKHLRCQRKHDGLRHGY